MTAPAVLRSLTRLQQKSLNRMIWSSAFGQCVELPDFRLNVTWLHRNRLLSDRLLIRGGISENRNMVGSPGFSLFSLVLVAEK